ncbi:ABC transporter substrate-binding protein [Auraticoccus sp. F435]|uniref:ABC transporter substrate-binding protein n=1 Tax=Auraticoccus cholistanensis TaxID=2656650 RepID=A0A6A9UQD1_9ACTN|nr:iron-siderophore ABC transporter substrate-binding protein [Auraticoccus cholistanensis]MVA74881.1 ABC transporter substrate-binding protein [Auraticoccus cholistanensis]
MRLRTALVAALAAALSLTACGTTDAPVTDAAPSTGSGEAAITVTDGRGTEVTLDGPATRVVTLEWASTEYVASLGVMPVGASDVEGYSSWASAAPLDDTVQDVGVRTEPSIDSVAQLEPDLILGDLTSVPEEAMAQMERIAPVVLLDGANTEDLVGLVKQNQALVGTLLGKEAEAEQLAADFDARMAELADRVDAAGLTGTPMVFTYPYAEANSISIRMHGPGSAPSVVGGLIGLEDAWTEPGDAAYGLSSADVEGLTRLPDDTRFLYWGNEGEEDPVEGVLADNAVWQQLPFVEAGHVHRAGVGIWVYGGTPSLAQLAEDIATQIGA